MNAGRDVRAVEGNLTESAYRQIKSHIINCDLKPNSVISASKLAMAYDLSIGPVRTALYRLSGEGLVEPLPQHGFRILPLTLQDIAQLYDVLAIVLPQTVRLVVERGRIDEHCERLRQLNARANAAKPPADEEEMLAIIEAGRAIALLLLEAADNKYLTEISNDLFQQVDRVLRIWRDLSDRPIDFRRDYSQVIEALSNHDAETAVKAAQTMVEKAKSQIVSAILSSPKTAALDVRSA